MASKKSVEARANRDGANDARSVQPLGSRDRILLAATDLFSRKGYERTTVDEIGVAAGLAGPSIYRHFQGKSQLLDAVIADGLRDTLAKTKDLLDPSEDPMRAMRGIVALFVNASMDTTWLTHTFMHEYPGLDRQTRERLRRHYRTVTEAWTTVLGRLRPQLSMAERQAMVDSAFWLIGSQAFYRTTLGRDELGRRIRTMVLGALLADDDPDLDHPD